MTENRPGQVLKTLQVKDLQGQEWELEQVSCPICGCSKSKVAHRWNCPYESCLMEFLIDQCTSCGFLFTNPRLSKSALMSYYSSVSPYASDSYHPVDELRPRYNRFIEAFRKHGITKGRLLEIGCDKGQFLQVAKENGFYAEGVEPSAGAEIAMQIPGLKIHHQSFDETYMPDNSFACAVMLDVLEHMHNPLQCLQKISKLLIADGLLLVKVPNVRHEHGLYPLIRGKAALGFGAHEHLSHFSMVSLTQAMEKANFEIADWLSFVPVVGHGIVRNIIRTAADLSGYIGRGIWNRWPDYHVSLVCLARKAGK
ncbi:MAG: class I SAM-dependent methyltransferase [Desulfobacterales bacterium]|nr:class I SAM-dependent methyltransferase [Desulfobacterales bacterium]